MGSNATTAVSLFIHSTGTGPWLWAGVPAEVAGAGEKLVPANIGYPPNPLLARGERCDVRTEARYLLGQLPAGADWVHLHAHSYGGAVALELARLLGERVRSLFLYEPVLFGALANDLGSDEATVAEVKGLVEHPWFLRDPERGGTDDWLEIFIDYWNRPGSWLRMPEEQRAQTRLVGWKMFQEVRSCFFDITSFEGLPLGQVPATLVHGERSPRASRAMTAALARLYPSARVIELPKVGHMGLLTHAPLVHEAMVSHARSVSS